MNRLVNKLSIGGRSEPLRGRAYARLLAISFASLFVTAARLPVGGFQSCPHNPIT